MMNRNGAGGSKVPNGNKVLKSSRLSLPLYFASSPKQDNPGAKKVDGTSTYDLWGTPRLFAWDTNLSEHEFDPLSPVDSLNGSDGVVHSPQVAGTNGTPTVHSGSGSRASSSQMKKIRRTDSISIEDMKFANDVLTGMGIEPNPESEAVVPAVEVSTLPKSPRQFSGTASLPHRVNFANSLTIINNINELSEVGRFSNSLPSSPYHLDNAEEETDEFDNEISEFGNSRGLKKYESLSKGSNSDFESGEIINESDSTMESHPSFSSASDVSRTKSEEFCQHFLKGKCRFRDRCRNSHNVINCIYCNELLPVNRVAASAHLHHCWRLSQKGALPIKVVALALGQ